MGPLRTQGKIIKHHLCLSRRELYADVQFSFKIYSDTGRMLSISLPYMRTILIFKFVSF